MKTKDIRDVDLVDEFKRRFLLEMTPEQSLSKEMGFFELLETFCVYAKNLRNQVRRYGKSNAHLAQRNKELNLMRDGYEREIKTLNNMIKQLRNDRNHYLEQLKELRGYETSSE